MNDYPPGYYPLLSEEQHHAIPALSKSGVKKLLVSPLEFWLNSPYNYSPDNESPSQAMLLGKARHCLLLEGRAAFESRFACKPSKDSLPGVLVTVSDIVEWLEQRVPRPQWKNKADLIAQAQAVDPNVPILDVLREHASLEGKTLLPADDYLSVLKSADTFERIRERIGVGLSEVTCIWDDPDLGVRCKARLDWIGTAPEGHCRITELKDFSNQGRIGSLKQRTDQVFAGMRYDIDVMFQARAWLHTPREVHGVRPNEQVFGKWFPDLDTLPEWPPQAHPEMLILFHRKDSEMGEFLARTVQLTDQSGCLNETAQTAWTSILNAAEDYRKYMAKYGPDQPWFSPWQTTPIAFDELPGFFQYS